MNQYHQPLYCEPNAALVGSLLFVNNHPVYSVLLAKLGSYRNATQLFATP